MSVSSLVVFLAGIVPVFRRSLIVERQAFLSRRVPTSLENARDENARRETGHFVFISVV
jgi:hypothetical protein